jgi:hypothetical protein
LDTESLSAVDAIIAQAGNNAELTNLLVDFSWKKLTTIKVGCF